MFNPIDVTVGRNLREKRLKSGMSQEQLGKACGLTFQQIQKYEKGINRISASRLVELAAALKCELLDLFAGVSEQSQEIETRSLDELRREHKTVEAYSVLPADVQKALCNLMEAVTIAMGAHLKTVEGRNV